MRTLRTRFLVVGSGAGGSVVACHLARQGGRTLLLERGPWVRPADMDHDELRMLGSLYKDGGTQTNAAGDMFVLQGSCVGGSTVLANGVCFRMPERVRRAWAGSGFDPGAEALDAAYRRVESFLGVAPTPDRTLNAGVEVVLEGARALGLPVGRFRKNLRACIGCGYCNLGCPYGRKLDAAASWIRAGVEAGLDVLPLHEAERVLVRRGRAEGVLARDLRRGEPVRVLAERTVLAGGAVATPELLLRSGLARATAGRRTSFNVGSIVVAELPREVDAFRGDSMACYVPGDGFVIEQVQNPPMAFALTLPGGPLAHARRMGAYRRLVALGVLVPTPADGRVALPRWSALAPRRPGRARVHFTFDRPGLGRLAAGFVTASRLLLAGGALRVFPPVHGDAEVHRPDGLAALEGRWRHQRDVPGFGSAHPQGGAVAGDDPRRSVVDGAFRVHGIGDLFVADASVFPASIEVNPQLTVMAVADLAVASVGGFQPRLPGGRRERPPAAGPHDDGERLLVAPAPAGAGGRA